MRWLAIILFAPWFAILIQACRTFPKSLPRTSARNVVDAGVVALTLTLSVWAMLAYHDANIGTGNSIWKQVAASTAIYRAFLGSLLIALLVRVRIWSPKYRG